MLSTTIACALALVVSLLVAVALWTAVQSALTRVVVTSSKSCSASADTLASSLRALEARLTACESGLKQTSGAQLAVAVDDLAAALERHIVTTRKQFGSVFGKRAHEDKPDDKPETDAQIRERLRLQHGLPRIGGGKPLE